MLFNYQYYENIYCGSSIPRELFDHYAGRAAGTFKKFQRMYTITAPIDEETGGEDEHAIIDCLCALADTIYGYDLYDSGQAGPITSLKTGEISASYASTGADYSEAGRNKTYYNVIKTYLIVYRGIGA